MKRIFLLLGLIATLRGLAQTPQPDLQHPPVGPSSLLCRMRRRTAQSSSTKTSRISTPAVRTCSWIYISSVAAIFDFYGITDMSPLLATGATLKKSDLLPHPQPR